MGRFHVFSMLWCTIWVSLFCLWGHPAWGVPRLAFAQTDYDAGTVYRGQPIQIDFPFYNSGDTTLSFKGVHTDCDCLDFQVFVLAGAESVPVSVAQAQFQTGQRGLLRHVSACVQRVSAGTA